MDENLLLQATRMATHLISGSARPSGAHSIVGEITNRQHGPALGYQRCVKELATELKVKW